jgi:hypothetical protein
MRTRCSEGGGRELLWVGRLRCTVFDASGLGVDGRGTLNTLVKMLTVSEVTKRCTSRKRE